MTTRTKAYIYLLVAIVIWGFASPVIKFTLQGIDPFPFLAYRFAISMGLGLVFFAVTKPKIPNSKKSIISASLLGTLGYTVALSLLFLGLEQSSVLDLSLIGTISPLVILFGGVYFFKDKITKWERLGTLLALTGTLITIIVPALRHNDLQLTGNLLLFGSLFADSGAILFSKHLLKKKISPSVVSNIGLITAGISFLIIVSITSGLGPFINTITSLPFQYHLGVWYMAVFSGSIAYYCLMRGTRSIEVSEVGIFYYLQPLITVPTAVIWLGEAITPTFIIGALVIATGVFVAEHRRKERKKK